MVPPRTKMNLLKILIEKMRSVLRDTGIQSYSDVKKRDLEFRDMHYTEGNRIVLESFAIIRSNLFAYLTNEETLKNGSKIICSRLKVNLI